MAETTTPDPAYPGLTPGVSAVEQNGRVVVSAALEIRRNDDGTLDEIVATGATVHLEQMGGNAWWMSIEAGGRTVHVNLGASRKIHARCEDV